MARLRIAGWQADNFSVRTRTSTATVVLRFRVWWRKQPEISLASIHDHLVALSMRASHDLSGTGPDSIAIRLRESSSSLFPGSLLVDITVTEEKEEESSQLQAELGAPAISSR